MRWPLGIRCGPGHDENAKVLEIIGEVKGKNCIIVDDFTISGGTLVDVAHGLKDKGAKNIYAFLSHVVLQEKAVKKIEDSPIELLVSTDTVDCPAARQSEKIKILSARFHVCGSGAAYSRPDPHEQPVRQSQPPHAYHEL